MTKDTLTEERIRRILAVLPEALEKAASGQAQDPTFEESLQHLLSDYYRLMQIAHVVRRGGVNAMVYRLETGQVDLEPGDYFDEAADRLARRHPTKVSFPDCSSKQFMLDFLRTVMPSEERAVQNCLAEIDDFLLADKRVEAVEEVVADEAAEL